MEQTICIIVTGRVQGVYYRQSAKEKALSLHISGTVQNNPDKTVTIVATGSPKSLEQLIDWCRKGPVQARVTGIEVTSLPFTSFVHFQVIR